MTKKQHQNLIMSAILPSTLCFLASCLGLFVVISTGIPSQTYSILASCVFGIIGYFGLIRLHNNRFQAKVVSNFIYLISGFVSYVLIFYWVEPSFHDFMGAFESVEGFLLLISLIWIFFVYVFYIVLLGEKIFVKK